MNSKCQIALLGALTASGTMASAAIITQTVTVPPLGFPPSILFSLPAFNSGLGTLNSVQLTLTPTLGAFGSSAVNFSAMSKSVSGATVTFSSFGSLGNGGLGLNASYSTSSGILTSPGYTAAAGPFVITQGPALSVNWTVTPSSTTITPAVFAALGGSLFVTDSEITATVSGDGVDYGVSWYGNVGGTLEVAFDYTAVPEPASYLAGLGALCLFSFTAMQKRK